MMILGKKQINYSEEFFVLEKDGQFFYSIKDAHEKRVESGPFEDGLVWTESNDDRLELMKLEYGFLSDWNIVRVKLVRGITLIELPTLDKFLEDENLHRSYVVEPGFSSLYLRKGVRYISSKLYENVLQIANCTAEIPGDGAFTALIEKIELKWSGPIFIEQVLSERFAVGLLKLGFVPVNLEDQDFCGFPRHFVKKLPI